MDQTFLDFMRCFGKFDQIVYCPFGELEYSPENPGSAHASLPGWLDHKVSVISRKCKTIKRYKFCDSQIFILSQKYSIFYISKLINLYLSLTEVHMSHNVAK